MTEEPKIVSLETYRLAKKPAEPVPPDFKDDMLAALREAVADVESGKLRGFVLARGYDNESIVELRGHVTGPDVLWLLERAKKLVIP
jgi:hypothetical protein